jgi:predicted phosphodiesterase
MERIVVLSDMQIPYHDKKATAAVQRFVAEYEPDKLLCVGDEADSPEPSRWNKGMAGEYAGTLQAGLDETRNVMAQFKNAIGDKPFHVMRSNHGDRISNYISRYAPALASLRSLEYQTLLGYRENDITYHDKPWVFANGWAMAHGDEGNLIRSAGGTALALARKSGLSIVCGHTHKLGVQHEHTALNGSLTSRRYGVEVGHLMDMKKAEYLGAGSANWQQGFGIFYVDKSRVYFNLVPISNRSFVVEGKKYDW